eukprot:4279808-Prymnesium_polylepis.1
MASASRVPRSYWCVRGLSVNPAPPFVGSPQITRLSKYPISVAPRAAVPRARRAAAGPLVAPFPTR